MNSFKLLITAALAATFAGALAATPEYVKTEVMVKVSPTGRLTLPAGAKVVNQWNQIGWRQVKLAATMTVSQAVTYFQNQPGVTAVEPNYVRHWDKTVNDPKFAQEYHLNKIKATQAWDLTTGNQSVVVAVLDSGFDFTHEDKPNFVAGHDFQDGDGDPTFVSEPHGVATSSCVAAATNNGKGIAAIGYNVKVMPLRVGDAGIPDANSVAGMIWAADHGAKVINMSYGGPGFSQAAKDASDYAWNKGLVLVASAGNSGDAGNFISYPAAYPHVISVGASDQNDQKASFSEYGDWVRVAAPGVGVLVNTPNNGYAAEDGTSFSGPITAGVVGLLYSYAPAGTTNTAIRAALETTCDNIGTWIHYGRINAFRALSVFNVAQVTQTFLPNDISMNYGANSTGTVANIVGSDNLVYNITTLDSDLGQMGQADITFTVDQPVSDLKQAYIEFEGNGPSGSTNMIYFYNFVTGRYDLMKSASLTPTGKVRQKITLPNNLGAYVQNNELQMLVRGLNPKRPFRAAPNQFTYSIGFVDIKVVPNS